MIDLIRNRIADRSVLLLGFGREGQSSYTLIREIFPGKMITIADINEKVGENPVLRNDPNVDIISGPAYLDHLNSYDLIFRSPGIPIWKRLSPYCVGDQAVSREKITSQTDLFLQAYASRVIGITGTKGKSTTASLIHHMLKTAGEDTILVGNIGNPAFHFTDLIKPQTKIVFELSSHQLEYLEKSPHIAVLLNLFQEHLDAYPSYEDYQLAKINIIKYQQSQDILVYNFGDERLKNHLNPYFEDRISRPFSIHQEMIPGAYIDDGWCCFSDGNLSEKVWKIHQERFLRGEHNLNNILAALSVLKIFGISNEFIEEGIESFKGLQHRLEYLGEYRGIHFYNDSISTIPEACMEAVKAIPDVDTLIVGGFDRGIDYSGLAVFLSDTDIRNLILVGAAGKRIGEQMEQHSLKEKKLFHIRRFDDFRPIAFRETRPGHACLLSPAAASYDEFNNFEERGKRFRELIRLVLIFLFFFVEFSNYAQKPDYAATVEAYIQRYKDIAVQEMMIYRIPASITLAQGIIESRAGQSPMAIDANNHFGIKCHKGWLGKTYFQDDDHPNECFRKYDNPEESFRDHSFFLTQRDRYKGLFNLDVTDYRGWSRGLQSAGYATNPAYADMLIRAIERFGLYQYDIVNDIPPIAKENTSGFGNSTWLSTLEVFGEGPNHRTVYLNNQLQLVISRQGDRIESLAREFGVSAKRLRKFNDLPSLVSNTSGEIIYLEPKRRKGASTAHIVREGETLHQISQLYGIKLKVLSKRNHLPYGIEPRQGSVLRLR